MGAFPDIPNSRSHNWGIVVRVMEFQVHTAPHEIYFEQGSAPARAGNGHQHRLRTVSRMTRDQYLSLAQNFRGIAAIRGLDFEDGVLRQVVQKHSALDFRLNDVVPFDIAYVAPGVPACVCLSHKSPIARMCMTDRSVGQALSATLPRSPGKARLQRRATCPPGSTFHPRRCRLD
jgi:hypothetical protein